MRCTMVDEMIEMDFSIDFFMNKIKNNHIYWTTLFWACTRFFFEKMIKRMGKNYKT